MRRRTQFPAARFAQPNQTRDETVAVAGVLAHRETTSTSMAAINIYTNYLKREWVGARAHTHTVALSERQNALDDIKETQTKQDEM